MFLYIRGWQFFFINGHVVNILDFEGYVVSIRIKSAIVVQKQLSSICNQMGTGIFFFKLYFIDYVITVLPIFSLCPLPPEPPVPQEVPTPLFMSMGHA